jgi:hypothetical protein
LYRYTEGVEHGIKQTEATVVVCDGKLLKNLTAVAKNCPSLKYVVTMGDVAPEAIAKIPRGVAHEKLADIAARGRGGTIVHCITLNASCFCLYLLLPLKQPRQYRSGASSQAMK